MLILYEMYLKFISSDESLTKFEKLDLRLVFEKFKTDRETEQSRNFQIPNENFKNPIAYDQTLGGEYDLRKFKLMHSFSVIAFGFGKKPEMDIKADGEYSPWFIVRDNIISFGHININISNYLKKIHLYLINGYPSELINSIINSCYQQIKSTIKHEVIHLFQFINNKTYIEFGFPSRKIQTPEFQQDSIAKNEKQLNKNYYLDDIEFYTNLEDSINMFKNNIKIMPLSLHENILKYCIYNTSKKIIQTKYLNVLINESDKKTKKLYKNTTIKSEVLSKLDLFLIPFETIRNYFEVLYKNSPVKYQKAAKEFYKAVTEN
jgi:hypothetical protein